MKIGILGTGMVGKTIGTKLVKLNHEVKMGSRTPDNQKAREWAAANGPTASQGTFADAAAFGEIIFNCTKGLVTLEVLNSAGTPTQIAKAPLNQATPQAVVNTPITGAAKLRVTVNPGPSGPIQDRVVIRRALLLMQP